MASIASIALDPAYRRVSVHEFLEMDFHGARAELEDGIIFMMAGGSEAHARVGGNVFAFLRSRLRGSGCRPYGPDFAVRTNEQTVRLPDVSVYCGDPAVPANERKQLLGDPTVIFEVLSPSTSTHDQEVKLEEYQALGGVEDVILIDPIEERIRVVRRARSGGWADDWLSVDEDLSIPALGLTIPRSEIFSRD